MLFFPLFHNKSLYSRAAWPLVCVLTIFYFGFHSVSGERGLLALFNASRKLEQLKTELADLRSKREEMEGKIRLMSNDSLDLDMLDEQARSTLGLIGEDEVVVFTDD